MEKTLLEILLEELPKRGGWPEGASGCKQFYDGEICFAGVGKDVDFHVDTMSSDRTPCLDFKFQVTREQYEQAVN